MILRHGIDPDQAASQAGRLTDALLQFDPDDPIRGEPFFVGIEDAGDPAQGIAIMGGHHRLNELYQRYLRGAISGDLEVAVLHEPLE